MKIVFAILVTLAAVAVWLAAVPAARPANPPHPDARPAGKPPHYRLWLCIHRQEHSAWNDPDSPYWGGLQMGSWFIGRYVHPRGTPDQWSPLMQMWVAEYAYRREVRERGARSIPGWLHGQWPPSRGVCF